MFCSHVKATGAPGPSSLHDVRPGPVCRVRAPCVMCGPHSVAAGEMAALGAPRGAQGIDLLSAAQVGTSLGGQTYVSQNPEHGISISPQHPEWPPKAQDQEISDELRRGPGVLCPVHVERWESNSY